MTTRYKAISLLLAAALSTLSMAARADVVSLVGDKDGLGIGVPSGASFDYTAVGPADVQGTDTWRFSTQSVVHNYALPSEPIVGATLELFTGGQGLNGLSSVFLNGTFIGKLTDGDDAGPGYNYAWKDTFNLTPFIGLLTGADTVRIDTVEGGDGWALDYSQLSVQTVPEPTSMALLLAGLGVAGVAARRRRG